MTDLTKAMAFVQHLDVIQIAPDELAHYGVLGMKWGRHLPGRSEASRNPKTPRKVQFKNTDTGATTKKKYPVNASTDHVESRELKARKTPELSNADIQKIVDRLQKEDKLKKLDPSSVDRGKKIALGVVAAMGTAATVYNLVDSKAGKAAIARGAKVVNAIRKKLP